MSRKLWNVFVVLSFRKYFQPIYLSIKVRRNFWKSFKLLQTILNVYYWLKILFADLRIKSVIRSLKFFRVNLKSKNKNSSSKNLDNLLQHSESFMSKCFLHSFFKDFQTFGDSRLTIFCVRNSVKVYWQTRDRQTKPQARTPSVSW